MRFFTEDLRYALRLIRKAPAFSAAAALTLALGIGANTTVFSVVDAVLLRPLTFPEPDRLVVLSERSPQFESMSVSYPNFLDWREQSRSFDDMAAYRGDEFSLTGVGDPERLAGKMVSASFFDVLGIRPALGRFFRRDEDRQGGEPVVVIGEGLWKRRFGASIGLPGKVLTLGGRRHTVIGVVPASFRYGNPADIYTPIGQWLQPDLNRRDTHPGIRVVARLKPGVTLEQARAEAGGIAHRLARAYPDANTGHGITLRSLKDDMVGNVRLSLWVLWAAVACVLLIACVNVANLLLARATTREKEIAVRVALGASRVRIVRQLITESVCLSMLGGGLGLALASWGKDAAIAMAPDRLPRMAEAAINAPVLLFTLGVSVVTGILFGIAPALQLSKGPAGVLKEAGRGAISGKHRLRDALVVSEVALSMVLLVAAGLLIRSLARLSQTDPGFDPKNVLTMQVALSPPNAGDANAVRRACEHLLARLVKIPGIEAAAVTLDLPLREDDEEGFWVEGRPKPATQGEMEWAVFYPVSADYLHVMRVPLLRGRFLNDRDTENSPPVAVIDEVMARTLFRGADPLGKSLNMTLEGQRGPIRIVGIVGHVRHWGLEQDELEKVRYQLYVPFRQLADSFVHLAAGGTGFVLRTSVNPRAVVAAVREQVMGAGRDQPVSEERTMEEVIADSLAQRRFSMALLSAFAAIALVLASVGIYGVVSYSVGQRTHEIGIRMALGARADDVLALVVRQGMVLMAWGLAAGGLLAFAVTRAMSGMLFHVSASDPRTFAAVIAVLGASALAAIYIPARRASRLDPMEALRYE